MGSPAVVTIEQIREALNSGNNHAYTDVLAILEKTLFEYTLIKTRGNQTKAAEILGLNRTTLRKRLSTHRIGKVAS
ncbi:protein ninH [Acinetobacter sp. NRRL B-65365]|uniref:helix-turn-helix domain-containing protein n=1 Tax=Acinetobacter sp. NRRL B-65365 TaxID=1785092 RepID=UPI0007A0133F|nr:helix-turn-helix domain-containing protein [Acinetobacter sp. NRRL B-65365]KYQ80369.1 protein ninH [Acinetobacter sp. NRRL B-65365]